MKPSAPATTRTARSHIVSVPPEARGLVPASPDDVWAIRRWVLGASVGASIVLTLVWVFAEWTVLDSAAELPPTGSLPSFAAPAGSAGRAPRARPVVFQTVIDDGAAAAAADEAPSLPPGTVDGRGAAEGEDGLTGDRSAVRKMAARRRAEGRKTHEYGTTGELGPSSRTTSGAAALRPPSETPLPQSTPVDIKPRVRLIDEQPSSVRLLD